MPQSPYAKLRASINGAGVQTGGITVPASATVQLSADPTASVGATQYKYEIYGYPIGFAQPSGWSTDSAGVYFYSSGATPPVFTLPSIANWGKFMLRLTLNNAVSTSPVVIPVSQLVDNSTALSMLSTNGLADVGTFESNQFGNTWVIPVQGSLRAIDTAVTAVSLAKGAIPAPALVATSNIALTGIVTVDGVASNTVTGDILATAQTTTSQDGYWTPNAGGAWTRPSYYNSDATVAAALGIASGVALGGVSNKGQVYYQAAGTTIAGAKTWVPARSFVKINPVEDARFQWPLDGSDQVATKDALTALMVSITAGGGGGCVEFPPAANPFRFSTAWVIPGNWSIRGASITATILEGMAPATAPADTIVLPGLLNVGGNGYGFIKGCRISQRYVRTGSIATWLPSHAYALNAVVMPINPANIMLKCVTAGTSGAFEAIGELYPDGGPGSKCVGTSSAACQLLLKTITGGYLGLYQFQVSTDAGTSWSATQSTVAGDSQTFNVDAVVGGSTFGATYGFVLSNQPYAIVTTTIGAGGFTMPAIGFTPTASVLVGSTAGLTARQYVYHSTAGLLLIASVIDSTHLTFYNVGASSTASGGTVVGSGGTITLVQAPMPRIEVLGTPPAAGWLVDIQTIGGPLGSAFCQYVYGSGNPAERHKFSATFGSSANQTTTAGATFTSAALPSTSLTVKFHAGLYTNGTWNYFTPSFGWSMVIGSLVTDGTAVWQVMQAPACLRINTSNFSIADVYLDGGVFNAIYSQAEFVDSSGSMTGNNALTAPLWLSNGDSRFGEGGSFTNAISLGGNTALYSGFLALIHDGGIGFKATNLGIQSGSLNSMYLAGLDGGEISGTYLEGNGIVVRNTAFFSRRPLGLGLTDFEFGGGYYGSVSTAYTFDMWASQAVRWHGLRLGGNPSIIGLANCSDVAIDACSNIHGLPVYDALPISGRLNISGTDIVVGQSVRLRNHAPLTLANGTNVDIALAYSDNEVAGPTADFVVNGLIPLGDGHEITLENRVTFNMTIANQSATETTAARRIITETGADTVLPLNGWARLKYSATDSRWRLLACGPRINGIRTFSGTTDTPTTADLQANIQSTGGSAVTVTLNTMPAGFCMTYSQEGAGAVSFTNGTATKYGPNSAVATSAVGQTRTLFWKDATNVRIT